ncbi:hypothetical protein MPSI1_001592 [Malassezia psittaci]|uniref:Uncharacterized protein n=1 Tax=Malassezia psittaci TaxID=1821823 RepID=A0AAF0FAX5_9BASI|nr:hypothetical protein MPSI1_001592 [Malassezia psittaci]
MNSYAGEPGISNEATSSSLTWQQQLMNDSSSSRKTRKEPDIREKREVKPRKPKSDKSGPVDTLNNQTWQQELFNQAQPRKSAYDFAADARDRETFGAESSRSKNTANAQETRKKKGKTRVLIKTPKTPSQSVTTMAYAGPTFHNSPHAASLPAPTFQGKSKVGSAKEKDSTPDLIESETGENLVTYLPANSEAVSDASSDTLAATQKPLFASQTGQRPESDPHARQPMELLQQALANHAQSSNPYHGSVSAKNVSHHRSVPSPAPNPASNRPHPSTSAPSGYPSSPLPSMQNGNSYQPDMSVVTPHSGSRLSATQAHPMSIGGPSQAMTTRHDEYAHSPSSTATAKQSPPSSSMQPTSSMNSASNSPMPQRSEAASRSSTPTSQFQSVDILLSKMLNSSSLMRR